MNRDLATEEQYFAQCVNRAHNRSHLLVRNLADNGDGVTVVGRGVKPQKSPPPGVAFVEKLIMSAKKPPQIKSPILHSPVSVEGCKSICSPF